MKNIRLTSYFLVKEENNHLYDYLCILIKDEISNLEYEVDLIFWSYISKKNNDSDVTFVCDDDIKINAHLIFFQEMIIDLGLTG